MHSLRKRGELKRLKISRGVKDANHAQFIDDTILLRGASVTIAERFRGSLSIFLKASDGKVIALKNKIYGWNIGVVNIHNTALIMGFPYTSE